MPTLLDIFAPSFLHLTCSKCTRTARFPVTRTGRGIDETREHIERCGWIMRGEQYVCPRCPQTGEERARRGKAAHA